jgi:hypothetical protein
MTSTPRSEASPTSTPRSEASPALLQLRRTAAACLLGATYALVTLAGIIRYFPDDIQLRGKYTTIPQPKELYTAAIRWHDFGNRPTLGSPFAHIFRHSDAAFLMVIINSPS